MNFGEEAIKQAKKLAGKIEISPKVKIKNRNDLSTAYTPGVAAVSLEVSKNISKARDLTIKGNSVAVVSDGSAVLGLGNIGPQAALPVMEGKCLLFKEFAGIDAYPIVLATNEVNEIVKIVKAISPGFGGINLEDIAAPRCFEIEEKLQDIGIAVFHDDQHGTAIVVLAALINALKVVGKKMPASKIVVFGAGAAGIAVAKIVRPKSLVLVDSQGPVNSKRVGLNKYKKEIASQDNYLNVESIEEAFSQADIFIGVSGKGRIDSDLIKTMNPRSIIFALSNPNPEIMPDKAKSVRAAVVATGRSDFPNQINNVLAFPGIFRAVLDRGAKRVDMNMKLKAAAALAGIIKNPSAEKIIPSPLDKNVVKAIRNAIISL